MVDLSNIEALRRELREGNFIIGTNRTIKLLKLGKIKKVYLASNVPEDIEKDIEYYAKLSGAEVIKLNINNEDLGAVAGKPFRIAVISIPKDNLLK